MIVDRRNRKLYGLIPYLIWSKASFSLDTFAVVKLDILCHNVL